MLIIGEVWWFKLLLYVFFIFYIFDFKGGKWVILRGIEIFVYVNDV